MTFPSELKQEIFQSTRIHKCPWLKALVDLQQRSSVEKLFQPNILKCAFHSHSHVENNSLHNFTIYDYLRITEFYIVVEIVLHN